jgi:hypothetical protein
MDHSEVEFIKVLGYFFLENGKFEKASTLFQALHELFPDDAHVCKSLSYACLMRGDYEEALRQAEGFLANTTRDRERRVGRLLKSKSLWGLGREKEAREALRMVSPP